MLAKISPRKLKSPTMVVVYSFLGIFLLCLAVHFQLILHDPLLIRDEFQLVEPLRKVHSFGDYFHLIVRNVIVDVQPVRDLSYLLDLMLERVVHRSVFHLVNLLIWMGILSVIFAITLVIGSRWKESLPWISLYAVHPAFVGSVAWVSSRKHLLSHLFILLATYLLIRPGEVTSHPRWPRKVVLIPFFYCLSMFSQPINALWPFWGMLYVVLTVPEREKWKLHLSPLVCCLPIFLAGIIINYYYYTVPYLEASGVTKFISDSGLLSSLSQGLRAIGRAAFQLLVPVNYSTIYDPHSWFNWAGLLLLLSLAVILAVKVPRKYLLIWSSFFILPLALVNIKATNIFLFDSYLLTPAMGVLCLLMAFLKWKMVRRGRPTWAFLTWAILLSFFTFKSRAVSHSYSSDLALWENAYANQKFQETREIFATTLLKKNELGKAFQVYDEMFLTFVDEEIERQDQKGREGDDRRRLGMLIYRHPLISERQKTEYFRRYWKDDPWYRFYFVQHLMDVGDWRAAMDLVRIDFSRPLPFGKESDRVKSMLEDRCKNEGKGTEELDCSLQSGRNAPDNDKSI